CGNNRARIDELLAAAARIASEHGLDESDVTRAIGLYGVQTAALLRCLPAEEVPGLSRLERARIAFAVRHEMARRLADLLFVSTYWGYEARSTANTLAPYSVE